ncbi:hypothetical protein [Alteromonas gilva]|uniref:Uncharacterized protein n=1 Tax=Alteromonas gilva TaxID=2987522 RepID=A0ABT5L2A7_9ALTE|nr:hypothetical protein [Alteromonas gilva]MDC8831184.1 hypothetical protein [Alteromonas gilva]
MNNATFSPSHYGALLGKVILATMALLTIPLLGNQLSNDVNWSLLDFTVMGSLVFVFGSIVAIGVKLTPGRLKLPFAVIICMAFVYLWVELAVGVFFNLGS